MTCLICTADTDASYTACERCLNRTRTHLRELELYAAWLPIMTRPGGRGISGRRSPGYGSRPPVNLDVLMMLDHRTVDDDDSPLWSLLGTLAGCAAWVRERAGHPHQPRPTISGSITYLLTGGLNWAAQHEWIVQLSEDIAHVHAQARALTGDRPPEPLGSCRTKGCPGTVFWQRHPDDWGGERARCAACDRAYDGLELVRLAGYAPTKPAQPPGGAA